MNENLPAPLRAKADPRAASRAAAEARRREAACTCTACGLRFATVAAFDAHRAGDYSIHGRRCLAPAEAGLVAAEPLAGETGVLWSVRRRPVSPRHSAANRRPAIQPHPAAEVG